MKKKIALLLAAVLTLSLTACGGNKKAFEKSKTAYAHIETAYEIAGEFSEDLYEAWRLGIYNKDEILEGGTAYLAKALNLSREEILEGVVYVVATMNGNHWEDVTEDEKAQLCENADSFFPLFEDQLFSFCVMAVSGAYSANGKAETAQAALEEAKAEMKEMSEKYSDYEHYPNLKGYYTTTNAFFAFCQNPTGGFEQVKTTINDYRNDARSYKSDLDYMFED